MAYEIHPSDAGLVFMGIGLGAALLAWIALALSGKSENTDDGTTFQTVDRSGEPVHL